MSSPKSKSEPLKAFTVRIPASLKDRLEQLRYERKMPIQKIVIEQLEKL